MKFRPYTYHIAWTQHNLHYYGVRVSPKGIPEEDLWVKYFTSSKYVKEARKEFGEPDLIEIRRTFDDERSARKWETRVLIKMRVRKSTNWLNKSDGRYQGSTEPKSPEHRAKISKSNTGLKRENKHNKDRAKIDKMAEKHRGMKRSDESKHLMSLARIKLIEENGGDPLNKGHKQYYNPVSPTEHIQCHPDNAPENWIKGSWLAATEIAFIAVFKEKSYTVHKLIFSEDCYYVTLKDKKQYKIGLGGHMNLQELTEKLDSMGFSYE